MNKRYVQLGSKGKELLFAMSGFGPNLLMVIMGAYFTDAVNPAALPAGSLQAISSGCLILPLIFPLLWTVSKMFDGLIDIPLASLTDNLKTKWGRRRPPIAVCFLPMLISYALCWIPISESQLVNTVWITAWALVFFSTYTMNLIAFYGSLSTVCADETQRLRVSSFKAFFDTISYCLAYALVPLLLQVLNVHIDKFVFMLLPLMVTMLIPVFMIKEGDKYEAMCRERGYDYTPLAEEPRVGIAESLKLTFTNKLFLRWLVVNCCSFFGLQMFLVAMNAMILGGMGMSSGQMAILNTCAFAPVPIMLYLFNKLKAKKGLRFTYQTCLLSFAVCILSFDAASLYVLGTGNVTLQYIIGCTGAVIGSWAIGSFFMMPYLIPAQISSVEEKLTGKNHSAMFFAAQAVTTSIVGAVAGGLVYENIKMLFISKAAPGVVHAENFEQAAQAFGVDVGQVFNLGTLLVPIIVCVFCVAGYLLAFRMPKDYTPEAVARELGLESALNEKRDMFEDNAEKPFTDESLFVNIGLWVLSGSLFGIIWRFTVTAKVAKLADYPKRGLRWLLSVIIPFYNAFFMYNLSKKLNSAAQARGIKSKDLSVLYFILGIFYLNIISYIIMQRKLNKLAATF